MVGVVIKVFSSRLLDWIPSLLRLQFYNETRERPMRSLRVPPLWLPAESGPLLFSGRILSFIKVLSVYLHGIIISSNGIKNFESMSVDFLNRVH